MPMVRRGRRWPIRVVLLVALASWAMLGWWHARKPLAPGTRVATPWISTASANLRLLKDITSADAYGQPIVKQEIFDETLRIIRDAREFVLIDMFLFNDHAGRTPQSAPVLRALSSELRDALIAARRATPGLQILLVTDPINDLYGAVPSPDIAMLKVAGAEVVVTDIDRLRDSNPLYSGFWRAFIRWWAGNGGGAGWLPNPLDFEPAHVGFEAWSQLLNFKANHRKLVIADDGQQELIGIVGSANAHDASSAHSNMALELRGPALSPLLRSELEVARFSGWRGEFASSYLRAERHPFSTLDAARVPMAMTPAAFASGSTASVRILTEGAIVDALLDRIRATRSGDQIDVAMFYVSDRAVVGELIAAAARNVAVRVLLDSNGEAFGRAKSGIPNRPVASELVASSEGAIKVRWYRTRGEQFHVKLVAIRSPDALWFTLGSANLTRRNVRDFNLEANVAVEVSPSSLLAGDLAGWFDALWNNRGPAGSEYSVDFGAFADPNQSSYWAYRLMEATGLSSF